MEVLYQRYFLRMNQNNMTSLLSLLIAIAITMIVVNYYLSEADSIMQGVTLGVFSIMYLILVILMTRSFLNEVYLIIFSYIVLASFFGIEVSGVVVVVVMMASVHRASSGPDRAGQRPQVGQCRGVVHHVLHLHDLHPPGPPRGGVHRLRPPAGLHSGLAPREIFQCLLWFVLQVACAAGLNYTDNFLIKQVGSTNTTNTVRQTNILSFRWAATPCSSSAQT